MKNFTSIKDVGNIPELIHLALEMKKGSWQNENRFSNKSMLLIFFNPSLRTRLSTQKAAFNLGINVMIMNINQDGWQIELNDGVVMDQGKQEHLKDAVKVFSQYVDIIGVRTFAELKNKTEDYDDVVISKFQEWSDVPVVSLESAVRHPLQSLADVMTIKEHQKTSKPKVVLSWAPHPKPLPQAVANSFLEWMKETECELIITHPVGCELATEFTSDVNVINDQKKAFEGADFVYAKNWSSYSNYGQSFYQGYENWTIDSSLMKLTNHACFMHCLPIRRNVVATDEVLEHKRSLIYKQAENRVYSAQAVISKLIQND